MNATARKGSCLFILWMISVLIWLVPCVATSPVEEDSKSRLRQKIFYAEKLNDRGNPQEAERIYTAALAKCGPAQQMEILSRLVKLRAEHDDVLGTAGFVQKARQSILESSKMRRLDGEQLVWADDIVDTLISTGKNSQDIKLKEYCLERSIELQLLMVPKFETEIFTRCHLMASHYLALGRYSEAISLLDDYLSYLYRISENKNAKNDIPQVLILLAAAYSGAHKPVDADSALRKCSEFYSRTFGPNRNFEAELQVVSSVAKLRENRLEQAKKLLQNARVVHESMGWTSVIGWDELILAIVAEHEGKDKAAIDGFKRSISQLTKGRNAPVTDADAGKVICLRHLIKLAGKQHSQSVQDMKVQESSLLGKHNEWLLKENPDAEYYALTFSCFPKDVEILPTSTTRTKKSQIQN